MTNVLVVDDSHAQREMICDILKEKGYDVTEAENGKKAQETLKANNNFDLVITDVVMPEMNGYEFVRWIKNQPETQDIPVLMCSTKSEEFDQYWATRQGADDYITKPFKPGDLVKKVSDLL